MKKNKNFKKLMILAITAIMCLSTLTIVANAGYNQVGSGTSTAYYHPFRAYYDYSWSACIYHDDEIGTSLDIVALEYDCKGSTSVTFPFTQYDVKIWLGHTSLEEFPDGNQPDSSTMTLVYEGDVTIPGIGWHRIDLDTSFSYNGVDNLIVYCESWDGEYVSPYPYWNAEYFSSSISNRYRTVYNYADGSFPDDTGYRTYYMTNVRLWYPEPHDVAVKKIISPEPVEGTGSVPVSVKVMNTGINTETFPVNVKINAPPVILFNEDFESLYSVRPNPPIGWLVKDMNLDGYISSYYAYNMWGSYYSSTYANSGTMSMRMDYGGTGGDDDWLFTQGVSLNAGTTYGLDWYDRMSSSSASYDNQLFVWIGTTQDNTGMTTLLWSNTAMYHTTHQLETTSFTVPSAGTYYIGFHRNNGYSYSNMFIDDVMLYIAGSAVYDQTVTMTNIVPGVTTIATLPNWNVATPGTYEVVATTLLGTDNYTGNDQMTQSCQVGVCDAGFVSVDVPQAYMGPMPFTPKATVTNPGGLDLTTAGNGLLPVHAFVQHPGGGLGTVFEEDFEGAMSFNEFEGETSTEFNPHETIYKSGDFVGGQATLIWPDDGPSVGDPADWTILNQDNDADIWHPTDYRYLSADHSMYHGDEATKTYNTNSYDWMISPQFYIGPAGGDFAFSFYQDIDSWDIGYHYLMFGTSADLISWSLFYYPYYLTPGWYTLAGIPVYPWDVDANGQTYCAFAFVSDSVSSSHEGYYVDDLEVHGSDLLYDETVYVSLPAGGTTQVSFPDFTRDPAYDNYVFQVCVEHPEDTTSGNDCGNQAFNANAPVWNLRTGFGFSTIQAGIDDNDTLPGDTIMANNGNFYEDIIIDKPITVSALTAPDCLSGTTYLFGTVDIVADGVIFENFYVHPLTLFTTDQAAIAIYSNNTIVRHNTVEIEGATNGTIKGIHAYATPSDFKQNIEISDNCVHDVINCASRASRDIFYFSDFETDNGGWTTSGTPDWEWTNSYNVGLYVYGTGSTDNPPSTAYSGTGLWGTKIYQTYTNADAYTVLEQVFDFSTLTDAQLSFWSWEHVFGSFDYCEVYVNGNLEWGPSWDYTSTTWKQRIVDLSAYDGLSTVTIEFRMWATSVVAYSGWYLDDVEISGTGGGPGPSGYGGAVGIMDQGATWNVDILRNEVYDVHSAGWAYGIEVTPTALEPVTKHFQAYLDFQEDFTGLTTGAIPTGWTKDPTTTNWGAYPSSYAGGVSPEMRFYYSPSSTDDFYLMTPEIDTSDFTTLDLSFSHYINHYTTPYTLKVVTLAGGNEYEIDSWQPTASGGPFYESYTLTASEGVGASDFQVAWVFSGYSWNINYWYFDDVVLFGAYDYYETVYPWPLDVNIEENHIYRINLGDGYPCNDDPAYPGVMLTVNYADIPGRVITPADASQVVAFHNWFDMDCFYPALAILNTDLSHCLMATNNYYSAPDGPGSFDPMAGGALVYDCITGEPADGLGSQIVLYGPVAFDKWLGLNAVAMINGLFDDVIYAEVGEAVLLDGSLSWAKDFTGVFEPTFFWNKGDGYLSMEKMIAHVYTAPGTYHGYLRVHMLGIPEFGIPPLYEWDYFTVIVTSPGAPLSANAGGGSLGQYETSTGEKITLQGTASGGTQPYTYSWDLGDGRIVQGQNPTVTFWVDEEDPVTTEHTVTLTVIDANYDVATDTATVTVLAPGELDISINAPVNAASGEYVTFQSEVTGGTTPYSYIWNFGDGITSTQKTPVHIYENAGTYTVTLTITDGLEQEKTATHTIEVETGSTSEDPQIKSVKGIFGIKATIAAGDSDCDWTINVDGKYVLSGGQETGTIPANMEQTVKLPLTLAFGKVTVTVTANTIQKQYTAFALGPFFLSLQEA